MAAVVGGMLAAVDQGHDPAPDSAVPGVAVALTCSIRDQHLSRTVHPGGYERPDPVVDGDDPDPGLRLGPGDPDGLLPEADIRFAEGQQLPAAHACVEEDQDGIHPGPVRFGPQPVDLLAADDMVRSDRVVFTDPEERCISPGDNLGLQGILFDQGYKGSDLFK